MSTRTRHNERALRLHRRPTPSWLLALMGVLLALPLAIMVAAPASAHTKLVSSNPANGAALTAPPTTISLTFNEVPESVTSVRAQSTDGPVVATGDPVIDGATVTVSWPQDQAPGLYRLVYVLVSDDGDPVEGTLIFTYTAAAASAAATAPAPDPASTTAPVATASTPMPAVDPGSTMGRIWILGVAIVGLAALALLLQTRRRRPSIELLDESARDRETTDV